MPTTKIKNENQNNHTNQSIEYQFVDVRPSGVIAGELKDFKKQYDGTTPFYL